MHHSIRYCICKPWNPGTGSDYVSTYCHIPNDRHCLPGFSNYIQSHTGWAWRERTLPCGSAVEIIDQHLSGVVLVRQLFVISHSFATSHYPHLSQTFNFLRSSFGTTRIPTQTNHRLLPLTTAGAERTWKASVAVPSERMNQNCHPKPKAVLSEGTHQKLNRR